MFIYESHLGGLFAADDEFDIDDLYCDECGDFDFCIGEADTRKEARALLRSYYDDEDYSLNRALIRETLNKYFEAGCYKFVKSFTFVEVMRDDDEYIVVSNEKFYDRDDDECPTEYFCGTKNDALGFAEQFEKNIFSISELLNGKIADEIPAIAEKYGKDGMYDMLPHIMDALETKIVSGMYKG